MRLYNFSCRFHMEFLLFADSRTSSLLLLHKYISCWLVSFRGADGWCLDTARITCFQSLCWAKILMVVSFLVYRPFSHLTLGMRINQHIFRNVYNSFKECCHFKPRLWHVLYSRKIIRCTTSTFLNTPFWNISDVHSVRMLAEADPPLTEKLCSYPKSPYFPNFP